MINEQTKKVFGLIDEINDNKIPCQEGDTALNLVIKSSRLRDNGDMRACCQFLLDQGALSTFKDLVRSEKIIPPIVGYPRGVINM